METLATWFKQHLWAAFLAHQAGVLIVVIVFLSSVKRITGRTIHFGKDPLGLIDGTVLAILSIAVILLTRVFYRWIKGDSAASLGIALTPRRSLDLLIGILIGFAFVIAPWISALWQGTASVYDRINAHFDGFSVARVFAVAFFMLLLQAVFEETTNRAFPMRLWEHRSLFFRLMVPSIFFVALHLPNEPFSFVRIGVLFMMGLLLGIAYAYTGNIWFASGVHMGGNLAAFSVSGLWHAGAIVALTGQPTIPYWAATMIMLAVFSAIFVLLGRYRAKLQPMPVGAG